MIEFLGLTPTEWALPLLVGVVAGLATNAVAIWMLFHPYEDVRFGSLRILPKGAIPQEIERIARKVGETVGSELLTPDDIVRTLSSDAFRERFEATLHEALRGVLDRELGPLRDLVPGERSEELETVLHAVGGRLRAGLDTYLRSDELERSVRGFSRSIAGDFRERPVGEILGPEARADVLRGAERLWRGARESPEIERAVAEAVRVPIQRILASEKPLRHYVPARAINLGEAVVARYLPFLLDRLGGVLSAPETRERIQEVLRGMLNRFLEEQRAWWRVVGRLVITERTLAQTVRAIEEGGVEEVATLLREPDVQDRIARAINEGVEDLLDRPVRDLLGDLSEARNREIERTVSDRLVYVLRHPETERVLLDRLDRLFSGIERRRLVDVVDLLGPERTLALGEALADWVLEALRGDRAARMFDALFERRMGWLLTVPIGRPGDLMPAGFDRRVEQVLADPLWTFIQRRVPDALAGLPIAYMVERKLLEFPLPRVEALIWRMAKRELVLIVALGGFLGALIGSAMLFTLSPSAGAFALGVFLLVTFAFVNLRALR